MYRLITESLLGLRLEVDRLRVEPLFPADGSRSTCTTATARRSTTSTSGGLGGGNAVTRVVVDGVEQPDKRVPLSDDRREHHAEVEIGEPGIES